MIGSNCILGPEFSDFLSINVGRRFVRRAGLSSHRHTLRSTWTELLAHVQPQHRGNKDKKAKNKKLREFVLFCHFIRHPFSIDLLASLNALSLPN